MINAQVKKGFIYLFVLNKINDIQNEEKKLKILP